MKQMPNMTICDAIMYHITQITGESKNPAGKKFGRKMLRDTLAMQHDITHLEFNVATQWLIDSNYLKPLGQYTVGIGTGKDLKAYPLNGYSPYKKISPEQLEAENSNVQKMHITNNPPKVITAADVIAESFGNKARESKNTETSAPKISARDPLTAETEPKGQNTFRCDADYREINMVGDEVPTFITKETTEFQPIEQSLNTLKAKLTGKAIDNLNIKLRTLDGLARLLDPEISEVLNQIQQDLKEIAR